MEATYRDHMGNDLSIINDARVSFGKRSTEMGDREKSLMRFLARGCTSGDWEELKKELEEIESPSEVERLLNYVRRMPPHWTPFGQVNVKIHLRAPLFVMNQIKRHTIGFVVNEESRRYVDDSPSVYYPPRWRLRAPNVKQGSLDTSVPQMGLVHEEYERFVDAALDVYERMLAGGVCPEQARMVLPQSMYTELVMNGTLYAWANLCIQRMDAHAQWETQVLARQISGICREHFPVAWAALVN